MSILLTGSEIEALEIKHKPQNGPRSFMAYSRAIQLALIEKLRKESFWMYPHGEGWCIHLGDAKPDAQLCDQYGRLPTPQELEEL